MSYAPETPVGRSERLDRVLGDLLAQVPQMQAAAVVSFDGLPMASALPPGMDEDRVAAMSAALLSLGERAADGLGRGELSQVYVEGDNGTVFLVSADDEAVLVAVSAKGAKVGLMLFEARQAAAQVAVALRAEDAGHAQETHDAITQTPAAGATSSGTAVVVPTVDPAHAPVAHQPAAGTARQGLQAQEAAPTAGVALDAPDIEAIAAQNWDPAPSSWA